MATASGSAPKRHLLSLPQELLDIILDFAYPAEDEKHFADRSRFEKQEKQRYRTSPGTFASKDFICTVNQWMVSKAFFTSATRAWVTNQHFRGYPFTEDLWTPFARVHLLALTEAKSILVLYCTTLSVSYTPNLGKFDALPSLKYLTLSIDQEIFEASEPAFAWEVALTQEQLEIASEQSGLSELPKLKQIKLVAEKIQYAKKKRQKDEWSSNVMALETLLQQQQKSKVAKATDASKLPTIFRVRHTGKKLDIQNSTVLTGKIKPMTSDREVSRRGPDATPTEAQKPKTTAGAAKSQVTMKTKKASLTDSKGCKSQDSVTSSRDSKSGSSEAQKAALRAKDATGLHKTSLLAPPDDELGFRIKDSANAHLKTENISGKIISTENKKKSSVMQKLARESAKETGSFKKRDAEKFYLPPPKRRALVKHDVLGNGTPARRLMKGTSRPARKVERPVLLSSGMPAPLPDVAQEATLLEKFRSFLSGGMSKTSQSELDTHEAEKSGKPGDAEIMAEEPEAGTTRRQQAEEVDGSGNSVSSRSQTEMKSTLPDHSTRQIFVMADDLITAKSMFDSTIGPFEEEEAGKKSETNVLSQGSQTESGPDQAESVTANLTEPVVISQATQTERELDQTEKMSTKLTEAKVCSQGTQTEPGFDEGEIVAKLKKLEQAVSGLLASHIEPKPARKPTRDSSVSLMMCSVVCCFLLCLWVSMKMARSNEYVAFRGRRLEAWLFGEVEVLLGGPGV